MTCFACAHDLWYRTIMQMEFTSSRHMTSLAAVFRLTVLACLASRALAADNRRPCVNGLAALYRFEDEQDIGRDSCGRIRLLAQARLFCWHSCASVRPANGTSLIPVGYPTINTTAIPDPDPSDAFEASTRSLHLNGSSWLAFNPTAYWPPQFPRCDAILLPPELV